jgi:tetratricopeptide (TPR) repeat protein
MDLTSRLRSIVRPPGSPRSELTYEPDTGRYEATLDIDRVADVLGGRIVTNRFGRALVVERRYESDRWHGAFKVGDYAVEDGPALRQLDPALAPPDGGGSRTLFVDLETTGLSGGAGTMAFLVGCGWFDLGAFQVRQFLLTSYAAERALLSAVADCFEDAALLVTYNGKTFDVPVMETRWLFHRMQMPLESVRHFDMLHPARRLWRARDGQADACCRLSTLEELLCRVIRVGDVPGMEIPTRYFRFLRSGDAAPLEPVLVHNRLDLVSLAAVTAYAVRLVEQGTDACRDASETLALGRVLEKAADFERAAVCYRAAADDESARVELRAEALYRLGLRLRRERRYEEASAVWKRVLDLKAPRFGARAPLLPALRQFAVEQLAIHQEHRERDYEGARELTLQLLEETDDEAGVRADATRRRLARLDRKIAVHKNSQLFA